MNTTLHAIRRSAATAWTIEPEGPAWAPWFWSLVYGSGIGLVLWATIGRTMALTVGEWVTTSLCITFANHGLFKLIGMLSQRDMYQLPLAVRVPYVALTSVLASAFGYGFARFLDFGADWDRLWTHMSRATAFLVPMALFWSIGTVLVSAGIARVRRMQLVRERERAAQAAATRDALEARLTLLNAQIEPHFLYNTLAHVSALIRDDPPAAQAMLESLIGWLRSASRNMARPIVPLADEIDSVRGYLAVMQRRMGERLRVRFEIAPDLPAVMLPPASLQPLVENAIKHGLEPSTAGGEIVIRAQRDGGTVCIEVADSGVGFRDGASATPAGGTGLANVRERLRLVYDGRARLTLDAPASGGAIARLTIDLAPARNSTP